MTERLRLLDIYCGAGGCAAGYTRAGWEVTGIDHRPQPRYLLSGAVAFVQADALEYLAEYGHEYDAIHASPPCQKYSQVNQLQHLTGKQYPDLLGPTRAELEKLGRPWILENVAAAPMTGAVRLCGSSFGLLVRRHRLFESSILLFAPPCNHGWQERGGRRFPTAFRSRRDLEHGGKRLSTVVQVYGNTGGKKLWPQAMGIDWMTSPELTQAIPPAFTEYLGRQLTHAVSTMRGSQAQG